jgi:hypothetical protein
LRPFDFSFVSKGEKDALERLGRRREGKGREGKGREGKGREGKGREGKGREGEGTCPIDDTSRWSLFHSAPGRKSKLVLEKAAAMFGSARSAAKSFLCALNPSILVFAMRG